MISDTSAPTRILAVGDMHGDLGAWEDAVLPAIERYDPDALMQVGDFGLGWDADYLDKLDDLLATSERECYWIDGNHENHEMIDDIVGGEWDVAHKTSQWTTYFPRGYRWTWGGVQCIGVGGAYSVDKPARTPFVDWWPGEELTDDDVEAALTAGQCDVMFAHDTFSGFTVPGIPEPQYDAFFALCAPNRDRLYQIVQSVRPKLYVHGHYHVPYTRRVGEINVLGLGCGGGFIGNEPGSLAMIDFPSLEWAVIS